MNKKLVLYSNQVFGKTKHIDEELLKLINKRNPKVGYVSSQTDRHRMFYYNTKLHYLTLGILNLKYYDFDKEYSEDKMKKLFSSDIIHLSGGNTFYFLDLIKKRDLFDRIIDFVSSGGVLVGVSAGSVIMTPKIDIINMIDKNDIGLDNTAGLGLVDFEFMPHWEHGNNLSQVKEYSKEKNSIVHICSDTDGIIVNGNEVKLVGSVIKIKSGEVIK